MSIRWRIYTTDQAIFHGAAAHVDEVKSEVEVFWHERNLA